MHVLLHVVSLHNWWHDLKDPGTHVCFMIASSSYSGLQGLDNLINLKCKPYVQYYVVSFKLLLKLNMINKDSWNWLKGRLCEGCTM